MIYFPFALPVFLFLALLFAVFVILIEIRVLAYAYRKIGVHPRYVFAVMVLSLLGSQVNVPLYSIPARHMSF